MHPVCKLYLRICRRFGPRYQGKRLTVSAWAWKRERDGRGYLLRELIDDAFLVWRDEEDHCASCFQRETAPTQRTGSPSGRTAL